MFCFTVSLSFCYKEDKCFVQVMYPISLPYEIFNVMGIDYIS